jgi:hypothetical protein
MKNFSTHTKKDVIFVICFFCFSRLGFCQVPESTKQEIINVYVAYAESKSANERLRFVKDENIIREILVKYYADRTIGYTPKRFGGCTEKDGVYTLVEYMEATQMGRAIEIPQSRYFVKTGNEFKLDWEASVCYNSISWAEFTATKSITPIAMRCAVALGESRYDEYWGIKIYDSVPNYKFIAYIEKDTEYARELFELLKDGRTYKVILEFKYVNGNYLKEVLITDFIQRGWVR